MEYNRLKDVLDEKKISQTHLAKELGISTSAVNAICSNRAQPSMKRLFEIASILNVPAYTLIHGFDIEAIKSRIIIDMLNKADNQGKSM